MKKITIYYSLFLAGIIIAACNSGNQQTQQEKIEQTEPENLIQMEDVKEKIVFYTTPSIKELLDYIYQADLEYIDNLVLDPNRMERYSGVKEQSLALGVYLADMGYLVLMDQHEQILQCFNAVYYLGEKLRLSNAFDINNVVDFRKNPDSLMNISSEAVEMLYQYLDETNQENVFALISTGLYIESLYISLNYIDKHKTDQDLLNRIAEQKLVFDNVYDYVSMFAQVGNVGDAYEFLTQIKEVFDKISHVHDEATETRTGPDNKLIITGGKEIEVSPENVEELKSTINKIRKSII